MVSLETRAVALVAASVIAIGALPMYAGAWRIGEYIASFGMESAASAEVVTAERLWLRELVAPFRKRGIWELTYEFKIPGGAVVRSTGIYTRSTAISAPEPGTKLNVRYHTDNPGSSYVEYIDRLFDAAWYIGMGLFLWLVAGLFVWWEVRRLRKPA